MRVTEGSHLVANLSLRITTTPSSAAELSLLSVLRCREPTTADWVRALFPCIQ